MRLATQEDEHLPAYDYSALSAVNMCPTWGIMNYGLRKRMPSSGGRSMALEAGSAAHDCFAAVRIWQLSEHQACREQALHQGKRIYGPDRWETVRRHLVNDDGNDARTRCINFTLDALYTSGFHDDPSDKRRTVGNIEEAIIAYVDRWNFDGNPVWVRDRGDHASQCGIEIPFDLVLGFHTAAGSEFYRLIGKMDGLHVHSQNRMTVHENKTASRLNEAWIASFVMSHQVTGYCLAASLWTGEACEHAVVHGLALPLPRSYDYGGIVKNTVSRAPHQTAAFFEWFYHSVKLVEQYVGDIAHAPQYTHSCNRYFSSCNMIPYCAGDEEEKARILEEMDENTWTPLDVKAEA